LTDKVGGGYLRAIKLEPGETIVRTSDVWHRQARSPRAWSWPPPSFGKLFLTNTRLLYSPPKQVFLELDRRIAVRHSAISSVAIVANPRTGGAVIAMGRNVLAWEALRLQIDSQIHWFAMQHFTQAHRDQLEEWLTMISEATGLLAEHERGP